MSQQEMSLNDAVNVAVWWGDVQVTVRGTVRGAVWDAVNVAVGDAVNVAVWSAVRHAVKEGMRRDESTKNVAE